MLVLSRKPRERIVIGDHIFIEILSVKGKQVRIGITAPEDVDINREEVLTRIQADNDNAVTDNTETDNAA